VTQPPSSHCLAMSVQPVGTQGVLHFPVTTLASGHELAITAITVKGQHPGPTVSLISGLHGHEIFTALFFRHVLACLSAELPLLRGRVVMVPMANPPSFEWNSRATPHDHADMNRLFPGALDGTVTQLLEHVLVENVIRGSDLVLDYHGEPDELNIRCTYARRPDTPYGKSALELALASGSPVIYTAPHHPTTLAGYAEQLGVLAITPELGGPLPDQSYHLDYGWIELRNMLRHVGALPGSPERENRQWIVQEVAHVRPRAGGLFLPEVGFDALNSVQPAAQILGRVISPYTFSELDRLSGPFENNLLMVVRGRQSKVHPGDPAYIVGNAGTADTVGPGG
jgi:uncharacterized protein